MSFRGRGGGGGRGGGRGFRGGRGGGGDRSFNQGPPEEVVEVGEFTHTCEDDIVCKCTCGKIPFFNAPLYFKNKEQIGKIDEIFGSLMDNGFSVTLQNGVKAASFKEGQKLYIDPAKLMPIERFLPGAPRGGRGRGGRGGRGGDRGRGGRGGDRGGG
ncbi:Gar1 protein RNA binding region [Cooperia oncophora]